MHLWRASTECADALNSFIEFDALVDREYRTFLHFVRRAVKNPALILCT